MSCPQDTRGPARHVDSLDGIRALCILAVMGHHFGYCDPGWIGVEMFFVLSGFLITTLLCKENDRTGTIALRKFWARRAFRLLPIYWLYISVVTLAILFRRHGDWSPASPWSPGMFIASLWAYFINIAPPNIWSRQYLTWHLWSLSIEEQFYFCWPLLCIVALKLRRPWLVPLLIYALSIAAQAVTMPPHLKVFMAHRPVAIVIGCTIALFFHYSRDGAVFRFFTSARGRNLAALLCIACLAVLEFRTRAHSDVAIRPWANKWLVPIYVWPFALLIAALWHGPPTVLSWVLSLKPLTYIGRISYGMYLYHFVLIYAVKDSVAWLRADSGVPIRFAIAVIIYVGCVIGVASLSYHFIEKPFLQMSARFRVTGRGETRPVGQPVHSPAREPILAAMAFDANA